MANEITASGTLSVTKSPFGTKSLSLSNLQFTLNGTSEVNGTASIPTTAGGVVIPLGGVAGGTLGWFLIRNTDSVNFVTILTGVSGTTFLKLKPLEFAMGRFNTTITAPAALADTASVVIEYLILVD